MIAHAAIAFGTLTYLAGLAAALEGDDEAAIALWAAAAAVLLVAIAV